jgi:hypothetical protein
MERRSVLESIVKPGGGIQLGNYVEVKAKHSLTLPNRKAWKA